MEAGRIEVGPDAGTGSPGPGGDGTAPGVRPDDDDGGLVAVEGLVEVGPLSDARLAALAPGGPLVDGWWATGSPAGSPTPGPGGGSPDDEPSAQRLRAG